MAGGGGGSESSAALRDGQSITRHGARAGREDAHGPRRAVRDREKLDEYFTSVRELEQRLARSEEWAKKPKPKVTAPPPQDVRNAIDLIAQTRAFGST